MQRHSSALIGSLAVSSEWEPAETGSLKSLALVWWFLTDRLRDIAGAVKGE
jgi:hypothetical protein